MLRDIGPWIDRTRRRWSRPARDKGQHSTAIDDHSAAWCRRAATDGVGGRLQRCSALWGHVLTQGHPNRTRIIHGRIDPVPLHSVHIVDEAGDSQASDAHPNDGTRRIHTAIERRLPGAPAVDRRCSEGARQRPANPGPDTYPFSDSAHTSRPISDHLAADCRDADAARPGRTRQGGVCRHVAMAAGKCRFHGGLSTGPRTAEGIERHREAVTRHGGRSRAAQDFRALVRQLRVDARRVIELA